MKNIKKVIIKQKKSLRKKYGKKLSPRDQKRLGIIKNRQWLICILNQNLMFVNLVFNHYVFSFDYFSGLAFQQSS